MFADSRWSKESDGALDDVTRLPLKGDAVKIVYSVRSKAKPA